ncbi:hypothetical protein [Streptomyces sp. NPDC046197]|uniref:hypothetical protein n=1 Tax=Streptomyces sp. NPDC046197 TaxID=3154337 RepID=UPI00340BFBE5
MRIARAGRRASATAVTALVVCAGAVATAAPAVARDGSTIFGEDNTVAIGAVTMVSTSAIAVNVTYSCEPKDDPSLGVVWRLADERDKDIDAPRGVASPVPITCDRQKHTIKLNVPALIHSLPLAKGDPVRVTASVNNGEGVPYARWEKVAAL